MGLSFMHRTQTTWYNRILTTNALVHRTKLCLETAELSMWTLPDWTSIRWFFHFNVISRLDRIVPCFCFGMIYRKDLKVILRIAMKRRISWKYLSGKWSFLSLVLTNILRNKSNLFAFSRTKNCSTEGFIKLKKNSTKLNGTESFVFIQQASAVSDHTWKKFYSLQIEIIVKDRNRNNTIIKKW